jgi:hypothetical protein
MYFYFKVKEIFQKNPTIYRGPILREILNSTQLVVRELNIHYFRKAKEKHEN